MRKSRWLVPIPLLIASSAGIAQPIKPPTLNADRLDRLTALYRDLHQHPEPAFAETRTAARLAEEMRALGFDVTQGVGGTGVVARLINGDGPTLLLRADMDGLPMREETGLAYASTDTVTWHGQPTPMAHSCGHDIHMAVWRGVAEVLAANRHLWRGTAMLVAQPAEETLSGARAMIDDGMFTRFGKPDFALALHTAPAANDTVLLRAGPFMSSANGFELTFTGRGGHGAIPSSTIDPIVMASRFVMDVQTVISREKDGGAFGVLSVGAIQAGSAGNIIPDSAVLRGTVRSYDERVRLKLIDGVDRTAQAVASMAGAPKPLLTLSRTTPAVVNPQDLTQRLRAALEVVAPGKVITAQSVAASDDFSEFGAAGIPSFYFFIGAYDRDWLVAEAAAGRSPPSNHSPKFAPSAKPTIVFGVRTLTAAALELLGRR